MGIQGLLARPDLNGSEGIIAGWDERQQRWRVQIPWVCPQPFVALKPTNIKKLPSLSTTSHSDAAKVLIEHGADVNAKYTDDETATLMASKLGHASMVDLLLKNKANPELHSEQLAHAS